MKVIYLDHSATTPLDPEIFKTMKPYLTADFANASSLYSMGQRARVGIEEAREKAAKFLACKPREIFFTSGATESNNLAILGLVRRARALDPKKKIHVITSSIEHPAVLEVCRELEREEVKVTYLPVTDKGLIRINDIRGAVCPETILISVMYVNNEVGTIQPIRKIGALVKLINSARKKNEDRVYFHTDAVQAANFCDCRVDYLGVDMLSLSAHKIYGPKGVGAIYVRAGTPLVPLVFGGHQESGLRSGTENVAGIVGLGKALEILSSGSKNRNNNLKIKKLRDYLIKTILHKVPDIIVNGDLKKRIPANANFCFKNVEGESILLMLDMEGISVSTGSACSSGSLEPSHVLSAMGVSPEVSHGSLRVTLGKNNSREDVIRFASVLPGIIKKLRKMSPVK